MQAGERRSALRRAWAGLDFVTRLSRSFLLIFGRWHFKVDGLCHCWRGTSSGHEMVEESILASEMRGSSFF
jgi:hypothetical protein